MLTHYLLFYHIIITLCLNSRAQIKIPFPKTRVTRVERELNPFSNSRRFPFLTFTHTPPYPFTPSFPSSSLMESPF